MAKKKKGRRYSSFKIPLAIAGGALYGLTGEGYAGGSVVGDAMKGDVENALKQLAVSMGFNVYENKVDLMGAKLLHGLVLGALISKFVGGRPLGLNRFFKGLPIKL